MLEIILASASGMTTTVLVICFCVVLSAAVEKGSLIKIADDFINNSNKAIAIISIDDALDEKFYPGKTSTKAFVKFHFKSGSLMNCENFTRTDEFSNLTSVVRLNKFRESNTFDDFAALKTCPDCDNLIFTSPLSLEPALRCFANSLATFLVLLTDNKIKLSDRDLMNILNRTWLESGALKVLVSINENVYSFDPFNRNSEGLLGKLNSFSNASSVGRFKNLNGHGLNVEMFTGTFTMSALKNPKSVDDFTGPDASAAKFIRKQLNATSLWMILRIIYQHILSRNVF